MDYPELFDTLGVGYDYNSIMHYDQDAFGKNELTTITALDPDIPIGGAVKLTKLDILKTNRLYNCPSKWMVAFNSVHSHYSCLHT